MKKQYIATVNFLIEVDDDVFPQSEKEIDKLVLIWSSIIHGRFDPPSFVVKKFGLENVIPEADFEQAFFGDARYKTWTTLR